MVIRDKRSISLPPDLADAIDQAADAADMSVSAWLAEAARHRLRRDAGRAGIEEWEAENGALTPEELAVGRARVRALLGRDGVDRVQAS
jgi:predicted transcriptional regulator